MAIREDTIVLPGSKVVRVSSNLNDGDVLWRYLDAAKFLDFVQNHRLYCRRGDLFDDKFEGSFTKSFRKSIQTAYELNAIEDGNGRTFTVEEFQRRLRGRVFVNCWRQGHDESMAMWRIYGGSSSSIALTTTVGQLRRSLEDEGPQNEIYVEKVEYIKHSQNPELDIKPYSRIFAYKNRAYEYENEVRIIVDRHHTDFHRDVSEQGMLIKVTPKTFLRSIVISPEAESWFESLVKDVGEHCKLGVPIFPSELADNAE